MLDLNHPMTTHVIRAMHLVDAVTEFAYAMTVTSSTLRGELLELSVPRFEALRRHNIDHFGGDPFIARSIDEYEEGLRKLSELGEGRIIEDRRHGDGNCPYCETEITKIPLNRERSSFIIVCSHCDELFQPALSQLHSMRGFGIEAI